MTIKQAITAKYPHLEDIRVRNIVADQAKMTVSCVVARNNIQSIDQIMRNDISSIIATLLPYRFKAVVEYVADTFDVNTFAKYIIDTMSQNFPILNDIKLSNITVSQVEDRLFGVVFHVNSIQHALLKDISFKSKFLEILDEYSSYKANITYAVTQIDEKTVEIIAKQQQRIEELGINKYINRPLRYVSIDSIRSVYGGKITGAAKYITDIDESVTNCVACGTISEYSYVPTKKDPNLMMAKFILTDVSGSIAVVMFIRRKETNVFNLMHTNDKTQLECETIAKKNAAYNERIDKRMLFVTNNVDTIVVSGKASVNKFSGKVEIVAYKMAKCRILTANEEIKYINEPPSQYKLLVPQNISNSSRQVSLFQEKSVVPDVLTEQDVVVIEFNCTGDNVIKDRMVAIGCAKISRGIVVAKLCSYINPDKDIPDDVKLGIDIDADQLIYYPTLTEIVEDIYKFCYNCKVVGTNIAQAIEMLQHYAKPRRYLFDNERIPLGQLLAAIVVHVDNNSKLVKIDDILKHCKLTLDSSDSTVYSLVLAQCIEVLAKSCK